MPVGLARIGSFILIHLGWEGWLPVSPKGPQDAGER